MASTNTPELKVILCGEYGVGKTSILRRFTNDTFVDNTNKNSFENRKSTLGLDFYSKRFEIEGLRPIKLCLWDTGGLERIASVTSSYYKFSEAALLCFSLHSLDSFHCLTQHLLEILSFAENAKIYLVGNKSDLLPHEVTDEDIELFLEQFPKFDGVFKVSCKSNEGIDEMFDIIAEKLASTSYRIKQFDAFKLHKLNQAEENSNVITNEEEQSSCCGSKSNCRERYSVFGQNSSQIIKLTSDFINCTKILINEKEYLQCICVAEFKTSRERWWFLAAANCDSTTGLDMYYNLTLLNNRTEWLRHFSADEYAVFPVNIITLFIYFILLIAIIVQSVQLIERKYFHVTYKLFIGSIVSEFLGLILLFQYNYSYSNYGYSNNFYRILGIRLTVTAHLLFLLLLILIAKGFSVTRARLKSRTSIKIYIYMTIYTLCYFFLYFFEQCCFDPGEVLYLYEGWIGYCLIALRFVGLAWFTVSLFKTVQLYPAKRNFFFVIYIMYFFWFVSTPILILLATFVIPKYEREQIVYAFENIVIVQAHIFFLFLTWPSKLNRFFPFHVRTSQIGAMEKLEINKKEKKPEEKVNTIENCGETLDKFSNYQYAPSVPTDTELLYKQNNVLFNKNNPSNLLQQNNLNLGDSNYSNERNRKLSIPDIS